MTFDTIAGLIPQSLLLEAYVTLVNLSGVTSGKGAQNLMRVDQSVPAVRTVKVPVLVRLRRSSGHVTEVGGP
jgi:hypothetical protein